MASILRAFPDDFVAHLEGMPPPTRMPGCPRSPTWSTDGDLRPRIAQAARLDLRPRCPSRSAGRGRRPSGRGVRAGRPQGADVDRAADLGEEVVALVVDHHEGREVLDLDAPDRLHAQLGVLEHLDLADAVLRQAGGRTADRPEVEAAVGLARLGDRRGCGCPWPASPCCRRRPGTRRRRRPCGPRSWARTSPRPCPRASWPGPRSRRSGRAGTAACPRRRRGAP